MADPASSHRRRLPLKAARDSPAPKTKKKAKAKAKAKARKPVVETPEPVIETPEPELVEAPAAETPTEPKPRTGWRRFSVRWGVVLLAGPVLVLTPILITWMVLVVFGPMAGYTAAFVKYVREDGGLSVIGGLVLGVATIAGLVVVGVTIYEVMSRRRARAAESAAAQPATVFALTAAAAAGMVATPLALFFGASWLAPRAETGTDISRLFTELDLANSTMRSWVILGLVLGAGVAAWLAKTGRFAGVQQRAGKALDEWADAKYDHEVNPDKW